MLHCQPASGHRNYERIYCLHLQEIIYFCSTDAANVANYTTVLSRTPQCKSQATSHLSMRFIFELSPFLSLGGGGIFIFSPKIVSQIRNTFKYCENLWAGRAGRSGDRIPVGGEIFRPRPDRLWGPASLLYNGYRVFPGGKAAGAWR